MKKIWKAHGPLVLGTFLALLAYVGADLIMALIFGGLIDSANTKDTGTFQTYIVYTLLTVLIYPLVFWIYQVLKKKMVYGLSRDLKGRLFTAMIQEDFEDYYQRDLGSKLSLLTNDMNILEQDYFEGAVLMTRALVLFLGALASIWKISRAMALYLLASSLLSMALPNLVGKKMDQHKSQLSQEQGEYTARTSEYLAGYDTIRGFGIKDKVLAFFQGQAQRVFQANLAYQKYYNSVQAFTIFLGSLTFMGGFVFGGYLVTQGVISLGAMIVCIQLSNHVTQPIYTLVGNLSSIKSVAQILRKMEDLLAREPASTQGPAKEFPASFQDQIRMEGVDFSYVAGQLVLHGLDLSFEKNKKYALVGPSGSGKSTIIKLLSGRVTPDRGRVFLDGQDIHRDLGDQLVRYMSLIDQEIFIFKGSLRDNVSLFDPSVTTDRLVWALDQAGLAHFVPRLDDPDFVSESGRTLSGGEKQRIAIARALVKGTPLILADEALSALDNERARAVEGVLLGLADQTLIAVTHRIIPENIKKYDEIIVLDQGKVCEQGSYEELMGKDSLFRQLVHWA